MIHKPTESTHQMVSLVDCSTLECRLISSSGTGSIRSGTDFNLYSIMHLMDESDRTKFITALNTHDNYECLVTCFDRCIRVALYCIRPASRNWSHILLLQRSRESISSHPHRFIAEDTDVPGSRHACGNSSDLTEIFSLISSVHHLVKLAELSGSAEDLSDVKTYIEKANRTGCRLIELIDSLEKADRTL